MSAYINNSKTTMNCLRKGGTLAINPKNENLIVRQIQSNSKLLENCAEVRNRNPRNLELLTIARKPEGYHLNVKGHEFWNKLNINVTSRHVQASVNHFENGPVVSVSTQEWSLRKQLFKNKDLAAFTNIGRILAQRCLESGISAVFCDYDTSQSKKYEALIEELKKGGIVLEEPPAYKHPTPWDWRKPVKPWTIE